MIGWFEKPAFFNGSCLFGSSRKLRKCNSPQLPAKKIPETVKNKKIGKKRKKLWLIEEFDSYLVSEPKTPQTFGLMVC